MVVVMVVVMMVMMVVIRDSGRFAASPVLVLTMKGAGAMRVKMKTNENI
jgi:hypothetical protein